MACLTCRVWQRMGLATGFGANTVLTVGANALLGVEGAMSGVMVARLLGPEGRGELAAIQTFSGIVAATAMLGMVEAVVYYCARNPQKAAGYIASATTIALVASVPVLLGAYFLMPVVLAAQSRSVISAARWYLLMAPVYALVAIPAHSLRGRGDFAAWNAIRLIPNVFWILVLVIAWWIGFRKAHLLAVVYVAAQALVFFPVSYTVAKRVRGPFRPATKDWRGMIRYGIPCTLTNLPQILNWRLDQIAIAMVLPARELGTYAVAVAWSGMTAPLLNALGATLLPSIASQPDRASSTDWFSKGMRFGSLSATVTCLLLMVLTPIAVVIVFGEHYRASVPVALVLVPAGSILALNSVLEQGLLGLGHPYSVLAGELAGLVATVVGLALTLRSLGIMSGALSSLAGYSTASIALVLGAHKLTGVSPAALLWPRTDELQVAAARIKSLMNGSHSRRTESDKSDK
jgi:O-antigen/teichoic acid export membrane protein